MSPTFKCNACNGDGYVDVNTAIEIIEAQKTIDRITNSQGTHQQPVDVDNRCRSCWGSGNCSMCGGRGEKNYEVSFGEYITEDCEYCHGSGKCQTCYGRGY